MRYGWEEGGLRGIGISAGGLNGSPSRVFGDLSLCINSLSSEVFLLWWLLSGLSDSSAFESELLSR